MLVKREIDIECPEGWEPVRFGMPKKGESVFLGDVLTEERDIICNYPVLIVRRTYQFPECIPEGWWLVKIGPTMPGKGISWICFEDEPELNMSVFTG